MKNNMSKFNSRSNTKVNKSKPRKSSGSNSNRSRSGLSSNEKQFTPRNQTSSARTYRSSGTESGSKYRKMTEKDFTEKKTIRDKYLDAERKAYLGEFYNESGKTRPKKEKVTSASAGPKRGIKTSGFKKRPNVKVDNRSKSIVRNDLAKKENLFDVNDGIRLNRYIAECGISSRRKAEEFIREGKVKINSKVVTELSVKVMPGDFVTVDGDPIWMERHFEYILLNKPKGVITTTHDEKNRKTVMDIIKRRSRIYPVGRLDRNTTGVLLLTNDGELAYRLTHPKYEIERIYNVKLDKELKQIDAEKIAKGIVIDGVKTALCQVMMYNDAPDRCTLSLIEGRNHEVRKLFESVGYEVQSLDRKYFATLSNKGMKRGDYRNLTEAEVKDIKTLVGLI